MATSLASSIAVDMTLFPASAALLSRVSLAGPVLNLVAVLALAFDGEGLGAVIADITGGQRARQHAPLPRPDRLIAGTADLVGVNDAFEPAQNVEGGTRYLRMMLDRFGNDLSLAIAAEATFVARTVDTHSDHISKMYERAGFHHGSAFVEVLQNCNIFNDGAWKDFTDREFREERMLVLEHGKPMVFGKDRDKGIRLSGLRPEVVQLGNGITEADLLVHDETAEDPTLAYLLSRMWWPEFPVPVGIHLRSVGTAQRELDGRAAPPLGRVRKALRVDRAVHRARPSIVHRHLPDVVRRCVTSSRVRAARSCRCTNFASDPPPSPIMRNSRGCG